MVYLFAKNKSGAPAHLAVQKLATSLSNVTTNDSYRKRTGKTRSVSRTVVNVQRAGRTGGCHQAIAVYITVRHGCVSEMSTTAPRDTCNILLTEQGSNRGGIDICFRRHVAVVEVDSEESVNVRCRLNTHGLHIWCSPAIRMANIQVPRPVAVSIIDQVSPVLVLWRKFVRDRYGEAAARTKAA